MAFLHFQLKQYKEALTAYAERGHFHLAETRPQAMAQLIEQWKKDGGISKPESVMMLASLNSEVKELNLQAQAERIRAGEVDPEKKIHANGVNFHEGDRLQFQKNSRELGVSNSDMATVLKVDSLRKRITVRVDDDGREINVALNRYQPENLRLGYASTTHKAQGASIPFAHVLMGGSLTDLHMGYVQASRSQKSTHIFSDKEAAGPELDDLIRALGREHQKTMAHEMGIPTPSEEREREQDPGPVPPPPQVVQVPPAPAPSHAPSHGPAFGPSEGPSLSM